MHSKSNKKNGRSNGRQSAEQPNSKEPRLKKLSHLLERYGAAAEEGAAEKLSHLAAEIVAFISRNRKSAAPPGYYRRHIE
jgi:hypothetical protein